MILNDIQNVCYSDDEESGAKAKDESRKKGNAKPAEGNKSKLSRCIF